MKELMLHYLVTNESFVNPYAVCCASLYYELLERYYGMHCLLCVRRVQTSKCQTAAPSSLAIES